jgi:hypothetical protein
VGFVILLDELADVCRTVPAKDLLLPLRMQDHEAFGESKSFERCVLVDDPLLKIAGQIRECEGFFVGEVALDAAVPVVAAIPQQLARLTADRISHRQ